MNVLHNVWNFIWSPSYIKLGQPTSSAKAHLFANLLILGAMFGVAIGLFNQSLLKLLNIDLGVHASDLFMAKKSALGIFFSVAILAPVLEEAIFRGPLILFKDKKYFRHFLYLSVLLFGAVHLFNFQFSKEIFILGPLLSAPQIILGVFLAYIRIKLGLLWAILLHASYNAIFLGPIIILKLFNISLE
ncbi:hypothetical protein SAMN04487911_10532 [Arenibacter nanhaiticus]|uniref:CAAX prenyl protease 2/Lysostaphin resistance protein A-like domain-containing protein n=1 Tax=Arenibacter nanhaiticus TaxID=558155 RepID=A0A1M6DJD3_9FLAO|nr:CPBP family intramembrane glutamic endopeptidase [Arenibacter nanhaiticus]SHI73241.1 hypothetical protein SAMN04487911_10532 [Arenibacter nanhaiticus]